MQNLHCQNHHVPTLFDYAPQSITLWSLRKKAQEFDISVEAAITMKLRYAQDAAEIWADSFEPYYWKWVDAIIKLRDMRKELKKPIVNSITDEMIQQAREVDVRSVVEFARGKAYAWCHDDKHPSLTYMSKTNTVWCPPCGKFYDSIAVLMGRDGMTFQSAVRALCG